MDVTKNRKQWLTCALRNSIKFKNKLYFKCEKSPTNSNFNKNQAYRNKLNSLLRYAERDHYSVLLEQNKCNLRKAWSVIKSVINKTKHNHTSCNKFLINDKISSDNNDIAKHFNDFFVNIGPSLAKNIPKASREPTSFITHSLLQSIYVSNVTEDKISKIILSLKLCSPGWDGIQAKKVKSTFHLYLQPLVHLLNLSLSQGVFPDELKIAKAIPSFKNDNNMLENNYRPISILPAFSKIFEEIMYNRLLAFITIIIYYINTSLVSEKGTALIWH